MQRKVQDHHEIVRRYARAFEMSFNENNFKENAKIFIELVNILCADSSFRNFVSMPLSKSDKIKFMGGFVVDLKLAPLLSNFLMLIVENGRIYLIGDIASKIESILHTNESKAKVNIKVPRSMSDHEIESAEKYISKVADIDPVFDITIDPEILSGYIITFNGKLIDASLKTKLSNLHKTMKGVV